MECYDAIIVGGGPAGSTCAWKLNSLGLKTLVLDRARFPRVKLCAGWITPPVVEELGLDLEAYARDHTLQPIRGFKIRTFSGREIRLDYDATVSYGIIRREFDHYLLLRSGAQIMDGVSVSFERRGDVWIVNDEFKSPLLIGAGGHFCPVARSLGADLKREASISAQELEVQCSDQLLARCDLQAERPVMVYCDDMRGYGWCFRKGRFVNVGIGRMENRSLKAHLRELLVKLKERGVLPVLDDFDPSHFRGHAYKLHLFQPRRCHDDGVLLVGDAAGLAYSLSGEGIRPAVESALLAGETIRGCNGDYSKEALEDYRVRLYEHFGNPLTGYREKVASRIPPGCVEQLGRRIVHSRFLARHLLINRWFLRRSAEGIG